MKGIEVKPEEEIQIDLDVTSYIPDEYISDSNQKIEIYQNIALCKSEEDIQNIIDEVIDRFGNMPEQLENLIDIARIKYLAKELHIERIISKKDVVIFTFNPNSVKEIVDISKLVDEYGNKIKFSNGIKPMITLKVNGNNEKEILRYTTKFIKYLESNNTKIKIEN